MNNTTILKKGEGLVVWIYKNITNKFTVGINKLKEWFPVLKKYPVLKYSLIPALIALFILIRYVLKFLINEMAAWTSVYMGETMGFTISEGTIVLTIAAVFIIVRIGFRLRSQRKKKG
jgi:hypothetical protein